MGQAGTVRRLTGTSQPLQTERQVACVVARLAGSPGRAGVQPGQGITLPQRPIAFDAVSPDGYRLLEMVLPGQCFAQVGQQIRLLC